MPRALDPRLVAQHFEYDGMVKDGTFKEESLAAGSKGTKVIDLEMESGYVGLIIGLGLPATADVTYHIRVDGQDVFEQNITRAIGSIANPRTWDIDRTPLPVIASRITITADNAGGGAADVDILLEVARFRIPDRFDTQNPEFRAAP